MGQSTSVEHDNCIIRYSGCRLKGRRPLLEDDFAVYLKFGKSWTNEITQTRTAETDVPNNTEGGTVHDTAAISSDKGQMDTTVNAETNPTLTTSPEVIKEPINNTQRRVQIITPTEHQSPARGRKRWKKHKADSSASLFAVFDGHIGSHCSKFLQRYLGRYIYNNRHYPHDIPRALKSAFLRADHTYLNIALGEGRASGSAAVVLLVHDHVLYVANAGDCRAVLCEGGTAVPLSTDHTPDNPHELERIQRHDIYVKHGRLRVTTKNGEDLSLNVSRGFGSIAFKDRRRLVGRAVTAEPDVRVTRLTRDSEFVVLASDGLWDVMSNDHVIDFVRTRLQDKVARDRPNSALFGVTTALIDQAYLNGSTDNITCVIVTFTNKDRHNEESDSES